MSDHDGGLFGLNEDILHIIMTLLTEESPFNDNPLSTIIVFARASRSCQALANKYIYRSVTLKDQGPNPLPMFSLINRLLDKNEPVLEHIRHLKIVDCASNSNVFYASSLRFSVLTPVALENIVDNIKQLQSFSWDANWDIEDSLISKLETRWPDLDLHVTNNRRCQPASSKSINTRLLSSPLLRTLNYSVFYFRKGNGLVSDFAYLMNIIAKNRYLKKLRIGIYPREQTLNPELTQFSSLPNKIQPAKKALAGLKFLKLSERILGNVTTDYCEQLELISSAIWNVCADMPHTTELELHGLSPRYILENLEGMAPNIRGIEFPLRTLVDYGGNVLPKSTGDINKVCNTIRSLTGIKELLLSSYDTSFHVIWQAITAHLSTLKLLQIKSTSPRYHSLAQHRPLCYLTPDMIESLCSSSITHLEIDVALHLATNTWDVYSSASSPVAADLHLNRLAGVPNLTTLRLCIAVSECSPRFAVLARSMAPNIFRAFYAHSPACRLKYLSICFVRGLSTNAVLELRWELSYSLDSHGKYVAKLTQKGLSRPSAESSLARLGGGSAGGDALSQLVNPDSTWGLLHVGSADGGVDSDEIMLDLENSSSGKIRWGKVVGFEAFDKGTTHWKLGD